MLEPAIFPEIAPLNSECNFLSSGFSTARWRFCCQDRGYALVRVDVQHPRMAESDICEPPILMRGPVIKMTLCDVSAGGPAISRVPSVLYESKHGYRRTTAPTSGSREKILLFIFREDENGDHSGLSATRIIEQANAGIRPTRRN